MTSTITTTQAGGRILTVRYAQGLDDWDAAIAEALKRYGVKKRELTLIEAIPHGLRMGANERGPREGT